MPRARHSSRLERRPSQKRAPCASSSASRFLLVPSAIRRRFMAPVQRVQFSTVSPGISPASKAASSVTRRHLFGAVAAISKSISLSCARAHAIATSACPSGPPLAHQEARCHALQLLPDVLAVLFPPSRALCPVDQLAHHDRTRQDLTSFPASLSRRRTAGTPFSAWMMMLVSSSHFIASAAHCWFRQRAPRGGCARFPLSIRPSSPRLLP